MPLRVFMVTGTSYLAPAATAAWRISPSRVRFQGRLTRTKKLVPGRYTLRITATNATGQSAISRALSFRIVGR